MRSKVSHITDYLPDDDLVLVPESEYQLAYLNHVTWLYMGRIPKVVVTFQIMDYGEHHLKQVSAYYNPKKLIGKPRRKGRFSAGWRSKFMMDYVTCFGRPTRKDEIVMNKFQEVIVKGKVRTVTHNRDQRKYPEGLQYSVVNELLGVLEL